MRARLPDRRPSLTCDIRWNGERVHMTLGFDPDTGQAREIFLCGPKVGSDLQATWNNEAVLASYALQHGASLVDLARSMTHSLIGHALEEAAHVAAAKDTV